MEPADPQPVADTEVCEQLKPQLRPWRLGRRGAGFDKDAKSMLPAPESPLHVLAVQEESLIELTDLPDHGTGGGNEGTVEPLDVVGPSLFAARLQMTGMTRLADERSASREDAAVWPVKHRTDESHAALRRDVKQPLHAPLRRARIIRAQDEQTNGVKRRHTRVHRCGVTNVGWHPQHSNS